MCLGIPMVYYIWILILAPTGAQSVFDGMWAVYKWAGPHGSGGDPDSPPAHTVCRAPLLSVGLRMGKSFSFALMASEYTLSLSNHQFFLVPVVHQINSVCDIWPQRLSLSSCSHVSCPPVGHTDSRSLPGLHVSLCPGLFSLPPALPASPCLSFNAQPRALSFVGVTVQDQSLSVVLFPHLAGSSVALFLYYKAWSPPLDCKIL